MESQLDKDRLRKFIESGLKEDLGERGVDYTSEACVPAENQSRAEFLVKDVGNICGLLIAEEIFNHINDDIEFNAIKKDGDHIIQGDIVATIEGSSKAILKGERLALNTMQRLSGICSLSRRYADEVSASDVKILDTRKTTPGLRFLEKWAVRKGGCTNYRDGLYDWIMIKDNHINAAGSVTKAVNRVHRYLNENALDLNITVEVQNLEELYELMELSDIKRVMLDNFELPLLKEAVRVVDGKYETEASGGVRLNTVRKIADTGVDFISVGALTHSAPILDISLNFIN